MKLFEIAFRNLFRRPLRTTLALLGLAAAVATFAVLSQLGAGYRESLRRELDRSGLQLMLVPLGCPYDAAARVLRGTGLEASLPEEAVSAVRSDPAVALAAPLLLGAVPRAAEGRSDMWVGIDESTPALKPWWRYEIGGGWFRATNSVVLGAEVAAVELRSVGDRLHSPELGRTFEVAGVLQRGGTGDDHLFFVPLQVAQAMFSQTGRVTAVAIRLKDPSLLSDAARRLQEIPGAQVVTLTEVMGVFLNLLGSLRATLLGVTLVALVAGALGVMNTLLASMLERTRELSMFRAMGASRWQLFQLMMVEGLVLSGGASLLGLGLSVVASPLIAGWVQRWATLPEPAAHAWIGGGTAVQGLAIGLAAGLVASAVPALRSIRVPPAWGGKPA